ncbi:hypothetical protein L484_012952 [Morus notabilis]|uniref:Uncharacterized protein n=1 Tax=Morus notabilis TaxID=981085 RepID=W9S9F3_9ROSA|nr:hypothetical protein L484_012952 [Morus notabilis]
METSTEDIWLSILNKDIERFQRFCVKSNSIKLARIVSEAAISSQIKRFLNIGSEAVLRKNIKLVDEFVYKDGKICYSDDTLPDGFSLRIGDGVAYLPYATGRIKFLWGDDAEEFQQERWFNENGLFHPESPFKFTAFQNSMSWDPRVWLRKVFKRSSNITTDSGEEQAQCNITKDLKCQAQSSSNDITADSGCFSRGKERAELLANSEAMKQAQAIYEDVKAGHKIDPFLQWC